MNPFFLYFPLVFIQVLFGVNFTASKIIVTSISPLLWTNIRFLLSGLIMVGIAKFLGREHPPVKKEFFIPIGLLSLLGIGVGQGVFLIGLNYTTSINASLILTLIPVTTLLIVIIKGQERATPFKIIGMLLSFAGVAFIRDFSQLDLNSIGLKGDLLILLAMLSVSLYISFGKKYFAMFDNFWTSAYLFLISSLLMTVFNFKGLIEINYIDLKMTVIASGFYSIIGATIISYLVGNWALTKVSSSQSSLFIYLQPLIAALLGVFFLGETLNTRFYIALGFIFTGFMLSLFQKD